MRQIARCSYALVLATFFSALWPSGGLALAATEGVSDLQKVIIDADMGELNDDAVALILTAHSGQADILGVTLVAGTTWVEEGAAYALRQMEIFGFQGIPVLIGAGEPLMGSRQGTLQAEEAIFGNSEYLGSYSRPRPSSYLDIEREPYGGYAKLQPSSENAVDFIVRQVLENPNEITLFVLGPPTNIALAVKKNPEIVPLIKRVIYMGGAIDIPGNTTPAAEFNWWYDPEATKIALRTPFKDQLVVPNDIAERVHITKAQYDRIASADETPVTKMYKEIAGPFWQENPDEKFFVWDAIVAAVFLKPEIATRIEERYIDIDTNFGMNYGRAIGYHESRRRSFDDGVGFPAGTQKVKVLFDIDRAAFWDLYIDLFTRSMD
jgi:inosine-uridine nucleoside N-ribohydrolase